jgi:hypothetical protein
MVSSLPRDARWFPARAWRRRWCLSRAALLDHLAVAHRLVRVRVLTRTRRGTLVPQLVLVPESRDSRVARPAVGDERGARIDVLVHESPERLRRGLRDRRQPAATDPLVVAYLHRDREERPLAERATRQPRCRPAQVRLVDLHAPREPLSTWADQHRAQSLQQRPRRLIGAEAELPLQTRGRHAILADGERPAGVEPHGQRRPRPIEQRASRHRRAEAVERAHEAPNTQPPTRRAAPAAHETVRPPQSLETVQTVLIQADSSTRRPRPPRVWWRFE